MLLAEKILVKFSVVCFKRSDLYLIIIFITLLKGKLSKLPFDNPFCNDQRSCLLKS